MAQIETNVSSPKSSSKLSVNLSKLELLSDQELAEALKNIVGNQNLPRLPYPQTPSFMRSKQSTQNKIREIQSFINEFQYNHTGQNYVKKRRDRGAQHIMITAKELIREALPIQCVEAVFIAIYLTADLDEVTTFPLSFKSSVHGHVYRHIVLAVKSHTEQWGALGISRSDKLMYKDLKYKSMGELINEFKVSYESVCHELLKVYVGLPFSTQVQASGPIRWRALKLNMQTQAMSEIEVETNQFAKNGKNLLIHLNRVGKLPDEMETLPTTTVQSKKAAQKTNGEEGEGGDDIQSDGSDGELLEERPKETCSKVTKKSKIKSKTSSSSRDFAV